MAKQTAPQADEGFTFDAPPAVSEAPRLNKGATAKPNPLLGKVQAAYNGQAPFADGHTDGVLVSGTVAKVDNKTTYTGQANDAVKFLRAAASRIPSADIAGRTASLRIRPLGPGSHLVGAETITVPDGKVAVYFTVTEPVQS